VDVAAVLEDNSRPAPSKHVFHEIRREKILGIVCFSFVLLLFFLMHHGIFAERMRCISKNEISGSCHNEWVGSRLDEARRERVSVS
jgi:hypothetical protein